MVFLLKSEKPPCELYEAKGFKVRVKMKSNFIALLGKCANHSLMPKFMYLRLIYSVIGVFA